MRVIVVGAGVIGLSVAIRLAERGARVQVVDAHRPGGGLTSTTFAWLNAGFLRVDREVWALRARSVDAWRDQHGDAPWLHRGGSLHLGTLTPDGTDQREWIATLRGWGEPIRDVGPDDLAALEPDLAARGKALTAEAPAVLFERDAWVDTDGATASLVVRLTAAGGTLRSGIAVSRLTEAPDTAGVLLATGMVEHADVVVVAAARATPDLVDGERVPLRPVTHESVPGLLVLTRPVRRGVRRIVRVGDLVVRPAPGGRLLIQSGVEDRQLRMDEDDALTATRVRSLLARAQDLLRPRDPGAELAVEAATVAARALPADGLPIVGWTGEPGRSPYVVVAHSGVVLAPALAEIVAEELLDGRRDPALDRYLPRSAPAVP